MIYAARFGEGGDPEGEARASAVRALCEEKGLRVSGPNCMGLVALRERLLLYPAARVRALPLGDVGIVFQSGGTFQFWLQQAATRGLGFSYAVSSGNELDLDLADYINFLVEDDGTRIIACMVEGVRRPDAFVAAAAKALAAKKPLLVLKLGKSARGQDAAASHTGALAGDDRVFDAVCRKYGVLRVPTLDDLIEGCLAFGPGRLPKGRRIAIAGFSGGAKGLLLDYASEQGLELGDPRARDGGGAAAAHRSRPAGREPARCRRHDRGAAAEIQRDLPPHLRRSQCRSLHHAGPAADDGGRALSDRARSRRCSPRPTSP